MTSQMDVLSLAEKSGLIDWRSDCGKYFNFTDEADEPSSVLLQRFACAILERAAVACEEEPFVNHSHIIRALKPIQEV